MKRKRTKKNAGFRPASRHKDTLTAREVSYESGLGLQSVYEAMRRGKLAHIRIGRRRIVSRINYERWLAGFGRSVSAA